MTTKETNSLWPLIEPLLARVERPSRYIDHEFNRMYKPDAFYQAVYVYPDTYEIGQSNQAIALLYEITNRITEVSAERAFLPWLDMIALLREAQIPLFSLESCRALSDFDLLGITIPHELSVTNILEVLDLAGLPLRSAQRDLGFPLVVGGGPGCFNPEPLAPFFDLIAIGESEELIGELIAEHRRLIATGVGKAQMLEELAAIEGVYVPSLYDRSEASRAAGEGAGSVGSSGLVGGSSAGYSACAGLADSGGLAGGNSAGSSACAGLADRSEAGAGADAAVGTSMSTADFVSSRADIAASIRPKVRRRVYMGFSQNLPDCSLVPFTEVTHDRLTIEVLRGCSRGCRFCQAGMTYRPVRERSSDAIVAAVTSGITQTGFDEVSLVSLSTTDHSHIESILRRLNERYRNTGVSISLPSQRLDAFGVQMAKLVSGEKKSGLTFAPEAGSQRLRDVINKNVSEDDLFSSIQAAYSAGWRRSKLYFMIGLPSETDA
ncbi:MAG: radical SAM protein, partial [Coriobacteriales bacterium]|nr:radical SAM protein [Coriobacteriales bacterium]